jgi:hypothetical protein
VPDADAGRRPAPGAALIACIVATIAFSVYTRTLLPGVDLGDTGGFQAAVLWPETSARQAYPLYYGLARPFVFAVSPDNPALGLNLFSALIGGLATGLLTLLTASLTGSVAAGLAAGLLLAFSHTFWTQSVIAEVYTLHLALIGCCLLALRAYQQRSSTPRLAIFFAVYAVSFGNHLSMILLLLPFALFLLMVQPDRRALLRLRTVGLAAGIAAAAALLYAPNFLFVWTNIDAPPGWADRVAAFWFDVTKSDWRGTMMLGVDNSELFDRLSMWIWDARLQFGLFGLLTAVAGLARLALIERPWAVLMITAFVINTVFVLTYNVGDPHVFFLPGHFLTALATGALFAGWHTLPRRPAYVAACVLVAYGGWRGWDTWPSATRQGDRRADVLVARVAGGVDDRHAVLLSEMDWQSENALLYSARYERRSLAWLRLAEVLPHLPFFVRDNHSIARDVVLAGNAAQRLTSAFGPPAVLVPDGVPPPALAELAANIPRGTPFVLTLLKPTGGDRLDEDDFDRALSTLAGSAVPRRTESLFQVWAGTGGESAGFHRESDRPFREAFSLLGDKFSIRMESWLPFDTFRRAGFGHVLRGREPLLIVERGVSLLWFERDGSASVAYDAGLYAPRLRTRIPAFVPQQVAQGTDAILDPAPEPERPIADGS